MASITIISKSASSSSNSDSHSLIQSSKGKNQRPSASSSSSFHHQQQQPEEGEDLDSSFFDHDQIISHEHQLPAGLNVKSGILTIINKNNSSDQVDGSTSSGGGCSIIRSSKRLKSKHIGTTTTTSTKAMSKVSIPSTRHNLHGSNGRFESLSTDNHHNRNNNNNTISGNNQSNSENYKIEFNEDQIDDEDELISLVENHSNHVSTESSSHVPSSNSGTTDHVTASKSVDMEEDEEVLDRLNDDDDDGVSTENSSPIEESPIPLINSDEVDEENDGPAEEDAVDDVVPLITPKMEGQSWSKIIFARNNSTRSNKDSESSSSPASFTEWNRRKGLVNRDHGKDTESEIMTLKREGISIELIVGGLLIQFLFLDMAIYGICPARDRFFVTNCDVCGQVVKYQALAQHIGM